MIDDEFLSTLPEGEEEAIVALCEKFLRWHNGQGGGHAAHYKGYLDYLGAMNALRESHGKKSLEPNFSQALDDQMKDIVAQFETWNLQAVVSMGKKGLAAATEKYGVYMGGGFFYEFEQTDLDRIQTLINDLRSLLDSAKELEEGHRRRLLKRLERLQSELHKKMSDVDRFWGFVGDAGVALGKLGKDAEPIVDRVREIMEIVWRVQATAEGLPGNTPMKMLPRVKDEG